MNCPLIVCGVEHDHTESGKAAHDLDRKEALNGSAGDIGPVPCGVPTMQRQTSISKR